MELFLNSVWVLVAIAAISSWVCLERRGKSERRLPLIALSMLVLILFPVISVSDDLWSLQNPAETDTCVRRHQQDSPAHVPLLPHSYLPAAAVADLGRGYTRLIIPRFAPVRVVAMPAVDSIENRPPPVAA